MMEVYILNYSIVSVQSLLLLLQGTSDQLKSSTECLHQGLCYSLICVTHNLPAGLPMLGPSQELACLQLKSFLPHFV